MGFSPQELKHTEEFAPLFFFPSPKSSFSLSIIEGKEAMEAKLCLCLMLLIWGTWGTVQGKIPKNTRRTFWKLLPENFRQVSVPFIHFSLFFTTASF